MNNLKITLAIVIISCFLNAKASNLQLSDSSIVNNTIEKKDTNTKTNDTQFLTFDKQKFNNWVSNVTRQSDTSHKTIPAQVSFIYPLGTNGLNAPLHPNNFSLNTHFGFNGGVEGLEIGGLINLNNGNVNGVQFGGIVNATHGESKGIILSGITNFASKNAQGIHIAGIANLHNGKSEGVNIAGITNIARDSVTGLQISGNLNYAHKGITGTQISNVNIARKSMNGFQLGFVNVAQYLHGGQIGFINIADSVSKGCPIGFLNIVRKGLFEFELTGGEMFYNLNFKVGTEHFYTIFKVGKTTNNPTEAYSTGIGWGGYATLSPKHKIAIDATANSIFKQNFNEKTDDPELLAKLDLTYKFQFSKHFSLMAGPTFNYLLSKSQTNGTYSVLKTPSKSLYSNQSKDYQQKMWLGFTAGVAFKF
ncbi:MAG: hypothetical protein RLZZ175_1815 [Bacteroidota bacterium]|jgi:hypothetical protein